MNINKRKIIKNLLKEYLDELEESDLWFPSDKQSGIDISVEKLDKLIASLSQEKENAANKNKDIIHISDSILKIMKRIFKDN